jgi:hypothetical protein
VAGLPPSKLDQLIVARTAAEEIDHFRKIARIAGDMGVDVSFVLSQPNEKRFAGRTGISRVAMSRLVID